MVSASSASPSSASSSSDDDSGEKAYKKAWSELSKSETGAAKKLGFTDSDWPKNTTPLGKKGWADLSRGDKYQVCIDYCGSRDRVPSNRDLLLQCSDRRKPEFDCARPILVTQAGILGFDKSSWKTVKPEEAAVEEVSAKNTHGPKPKRAVVEQMARKLDALATCVNTIPFFFVSGRMGRREPAERGGEQEIQNDDVTSRIYPELDSTMVLSIDR